MNNDLIERLRGLLAKAANDAPLPWQVETEKSEGEYGRGPYTHSGFHVSVIQDAKGITLFDPHNSGAIIVDEEFDDDGFCYAWDIVSGKTAPIITEAVNSLPTLLDTIEALRAEIAAKDARIGELEKARTRLRNGYADAASGYDYILVHHDRLSGVGFDRVLDHFAEWVTIPEREGLLAGSHVLAAAIRSQDDD